MQILARAQVCFGGRGFALEIQKIEKQESWPDKQCWINLPKFSCALESLSDQCTLWSSEADRSKEYSHFTHSISKVFRVITLHSEPELLCSVKMHILIGAQYSWSDTHYRFFVYGEPFGEARSLSNLADPGRCLVSDAVRTWGHLLASYYYLTFFIRESRIVKMCHEDCVPIVRIHGQGTRWSRYSTVEWFQITEILRR